MCGAAQGRAAGAPLRGRFGKDEAVLDQTRTSEKLASKRSTPHSKRLAGSLLAASALTLAACAVGPDFKRPSPELPPQWSATANQAAGQTGAVVAPADDRTWWSKFNDPELTSLVDRTLAANLDLKQATLRIAEARAQRAAAAAADLLPKVDASAGYTTNRLSEGTPTGKLFTGGLHLPGGAKISVPNPYDQYQLGFDASWEVDLFGRVRRSVEAADAEALSAVEAEHGLRLSLSAEAAQTYFDLRSAQARRALTAQSIADARELADLAGQKRAAGLSSDVDLSQAQAQALTGEAQLPGLDRQITADINALSRLIGREPDALRGELDAPGALPAPPPAIPIGAPADLARRRPDVRQAEARLHAATARVGVAEASLFPRLTIGGPAALQSERAADLLKWSSRFYQLGPSLQIPVFEGGKMRAEVKLQKASEQEAALAYKSAVLSAMHDVENALTALSADREQRIKLDQATTRYRDARDLARERYQAGVGSYIQVLDAERTLLQTELAHAQAAQAESTDAAALYKALGGGWGVS